MKIDAFHIDGYGVHHDLGATDLPDGLTIVSGPNEAGKTTLQHFLVGMLFGFTASNRPDHHAPLRGGTYGGRMVVADDDGRTLTIHRGARKSSLRLTDDRGPVPEGELQALLGNASRDLYQSIFAVHIDELDELKALSDEQVRDRVFSAGILGAGRTAQQALAAIADERDQLLKPNGRGADKYVIKRLRAELTDARAHLAEVRRDAKGLPALTSRIGAVERDKAAARERRASLHAERSLLAAVADLWPTWADAAEARAELDRLGEVHPVPDDVEGRLDQAAQRADDLAALADDAATAHATARDALDALAAPGPAGAHAERIAELAAAVPVEAERDSTVVDLEARATHQADELATALAVLGDDHDEAWLTRQTDPAEAGPALRTAAADVAAARNRVAQLADAHRRDASDLDDATAELEALEASLETAPHHPADRARTAAEDAATLVTLLGQRDAAAHRAALADEAAAAPEAPSFVAPTLWISALVVALVAAGALATGAPAVGAGALAVAALLAGLGIAVRRNGAASPGRTGSGATARAHHDLDELDQAIAPLLAGFGIEARPSVAEASSLRSKAEQLAAEAVRLDADRRQHDLRRAALEQKRARTAARHATEQTEARAALDAAQAAWRARLEQLGLDPRLDPAGAGEVLEQLTRARALQRSLADTRAELERAIVRRRAFAEQVRTLVDDHQLPVDADPESDPVAAIAELSDAAAGDRAAQRAIDDATIALDAARRQHDQAVERADRARTAVDAVIEELGAADLADARRRIERAATADDLRRRIAAADRDLATAVGAVPERLDAARALLGQADPTRWAQQLAELDRDLHAAEEHADEKITELAHLELERQELERSADVPAAELRVADLEAQLATAVRRWASLTTAHQLVEATLARYQRERQPDVITRAGAHFALLTDGRYPRLEVRDRSVLVIDATGRDAPAEALSTGTLQQLYLSLRFALAESYARTARLPLLLDDVTVNADGDRHPRLAELIAQVAADHQVLVFTCHDRTVELLGAAAPGARHLELPSSRTGSDVATGPRRLGLAAG